MSFVNISKMQNTRRFSSREGKSLLKRFIFKTRRRSVRSATFPCFVCLLAGGTLASKAFVKRFVLKIASC